ncbi:phosphoribosylaminoimidazolesuccinocarboxamide synthase, partial [Klebsiella pneumoniae]|nr:phosphoribosylaminoimidazolesuccinocarboxamide synthase [Klebsiella pneumoniae]
MVALADYPQIAAGKVRQLHAVDEEHLLLVASDRISAYDHVLSTPIPDKGRVLTAMSVFWFELLA